MKTHIELTKISRTARLCDVRMMQDFDGVVIVTSRAHFSPEQHETAKALLLGMLNSKSKETQEYERAWARIAIETWYEEKKPEEAR